ncbi:hypothetical protein SH449x_002082 [Pirellulaceae bacterium SH449]
MSQSIPMILLTMVLHLLFCVKGHANANDGLEVELQSLVKEQVIPMIDKRGGGTVAVGGFTASSNIQGTAGPELQLKLAKLLEEAGMSLDPVDYRFELTGNYLPYNDNDSGLYGVKLVSRLIDAESGSTLGEFSRFLFDTEAVPRLLGLNVSLHGTTQPKLQSVAFQRAVKSPESYVVASQIATTPTSEYSIEILVLERGKYVPRRIDSESSRWPFVQLERNDVYAIRLLNHSDHEAAAAVTIDGVNVFEFSEQNPKPNYWVIPRSQGTQPGAITIHGWDRTASRSTQFKVVDFPDGAAARIQLAPSPATGMISVSFHACWEDEKDRPRSEGRTRATGFGKEIVDEKTHVKRQVGVVRDVVSVRYEKPMFDDRSQPVALRQRAGE